jgi:hypothetical protein
MRHHQPVLSGAAPDTGTLRGDVLAVLRRASRRIAAIGPDTVIGMLSDLLSDEEALEQILQQLLRSGGEVMSGVLDSAVARGEARDDIAPRVARLPLDLLRHELLLTHQPPSPRVLEEIVDEIFLPLVHSRHLSRALARVLLLGCRARWWRSEPREPLTGTFIDSVVHRAFAPASQQPRGGLQPAACLGGLDRFGAVACAELADRGGEVVADRAL